MWEAAWLLLGLCGLRSRAARPFVFVLLANWSLIYLTVLLSGGAEIAYAAAIPLDATAFCLCYFLYLRAPARRRWVQLLVAGYGLSLAGQFAYWSADALGWYAGTELFWFARAVFTGQMLAVSYPGGRDLVRDVHRLYPSPRPRYSVGSVRAVLAGCGSRRRAPRVSARVPQDPRQ